MNKKLLLPTEKLNQLRLIAAEDGRDGAVTVHQDASVYASVLEPGREVVHQMAPERHAWLQVARGAITVNGIELEQGDGAAISNESILTIAGRDQSEVLLFDLA